MASITEKAYSITKTLFKIVKKYIFKGEKTSINAFSVPKVCISPEPGKYAGLVHFTGID